MKLAILAFPREYPASFPIRKLASALHYKRNPRDEKYMRELAEEQLGKDVIIAPATDPRIRDLAKKADEVILLWPDGNGYGWFATELRVFLKRGFRGVKILNGRQRMFALQASSWLSYGTRRAFERFWLSEIAFTLGFIVATPFLIGWDLARGRK